MGILGSFNRSLNVRKRLNCKNDYNLKRKYTRLTKTIHIYYGKVARKINNLITSMYISRFFIIKCKPKSQIDRRRHAVKLEKKIAMIYNLTTNSNDFQ